MKAPVQFYVCSRHAVNFADSEHHSEGLQTPCAIPNCNAAAEWVVQRLVDCEKVDPRKVYLLSNEMVAAFDGQGRQVPQLQGRWQDVKPLLTQFLNIEEMMTLETRGEVSHQ